MKWDILRWSGLLGSNESVRLSGLGEGGRVGGADFVLREPRSGISLLCPRPSLVAVV